MIHISILFSSILFYSLSLSLSSEYCVHCFNTVQTNTFFLRNGNILWRLVTSCDIGENRLEDTETYLAGQHLVQLLLRDAQTLPVCAVYHQDDKL